MTDNLLIGTELKSPTLQYKIESVLGQGSFGVTYKAKGFTVVKGALGEMKMELPNPIAIKEFFMRDINQRDDSGTITGMTQGSMAYNYALKFRKEAENLARMNHPNIIRVIDFIEANNTFYYVMEYIEGEDMNHYLKSHKLSEADAVAIVIDVANALTYMHEEQRMLHLDLKPGNIMRRKSDGHIFLIDFGLSKHYGDDGNPDTSTTVGLGTEGYAPLEQGKRTNNRNDFLPTIDVYALGATLFKLLTGNTPPAASDVLDDEDLLPTELKAANVSQELIDIVIKAMKPRAKKRIQSVGEFMSMLSSSSNVNDERTIILSNPQVNSKEEKKQIQFDKIDNLESLDEETRLVLSKEDVAKIVLFGRKGIINQPCNQPIDIGLNVMWYNSNIGACDTYDGGDFCPKGDSFYEKYCINNEEKHIPTSDQWKELIQECEWTWVEEYNCTGFLIKGPNGKYIFLPAAGKSTANGIEEDGFEGYYWSLGSANGNASVELNLKFTYPPSFKYIGLSYMPNVVAMPIRLVKNKL
ncbi:MAG: protein kinase [Prevotellaceae bacterium]|nr:protein kinase [Candidatus Minthosoma equi]